MRVFHQPLRLLLCMLVLCAAWPPFAPQDINRDRNIDLTDAVLTVRDFANSAEQPDQFRQRVQAAVSTLQATAGLITVLCDDNNAKASLGSSPVLPGLLKATVLIIPPPGFKEPIFAAAQPFTSHTIVPETPPPRLG